MDVLLEGLAVIFITPFIGIGMLIMLCFLIVGIVIFISLWALVLGWVAGVLILFYYGLEYIAFSLFRGVRNLLSSICDSYTKYKRRLWCRYEKNLERF